MATVREKYNLTLFNAEQNNKGLGNSVVTRSRTLSKELTLNYNNRCLQACGRAAELARAQTEDPEAGEVDTGTGGDEPGEVEEAFL